MMSLEGVQEVVCLLGFISYCIFGSEIQNAN